MTHTPTVSRRAVLKTLGTVGVLSALSVPASASPTGRYIVGTRSPAASRTARSRAQSVYRTLEFGALGTAVVGRFSAAALRALAARPDVAYVEPDGLMHAISVDATDAEVPWGVDRVDAEKVHATSTGSGIDLAVIDTGIDNDHPDLVGNLGAGVAFALRNPNKTQSTDPTDWDDGNGHGTHCAGTADAVDHADGTGVLGVSTAATLHAVKVLHDNGSGSYSDVAAGIKYVADQGWHVGSLSLGGPLSSTIENACQYAADAGVLLVAAAGNDGADVAATAPAAYPTVMAVSATDDTDAVTSWSNYGEEIELAAPGATIYSTYKDGGYNTLSGTSMACPHVSGAAAQVWAVDPAMSNQNVRDLLNGSGEDLGAAGFDVYYGNGLLDAEAAVLAAGGGSDTSDTTAPTFDVQPTAVDDGDGDTTVSNGDVVRVSAAVSDDTGVASVTVDASPFGGATNVSLADGDANGVWEGTFTVDSTSSTDFSSVLTVTASDGAGNSATADTNGLTFVAGSTSSGTNPAVDSLTYTVDSPTNPHAGYYVTADVSDADGDLSSLYMRFERSDGTFVDDRTVSVSGSADSATVYFEEKFGARNGYTYQVTATVTDATGLTGDKSVTDISG